MGSGNALSTLVATGAVFLRTGRGFAEDDVVFPGKNTT